MTRRTQSERNQQRLRRFRRDLIVSRLKAVIRWIITSSSFLAIFVGFLAIVFRKSYLEYEVVSKADYVCEVTYYGSSGVSTTRFYTNDDFRKTHVMTSIKGRVWDLDKFHNYLCLASGLKDKHGNVDDGVNEPEGSISMNPPLTEKK